ncbi:hypothetical protein [Paraburkholderia tropica]|uniref:hypothetical protein n=1 Tax=Paraburkholderia tropica TaxID=92647 RepID=UPI002AB0A931|nr:hypothetical protein [Paraburkholderia tropica]
MDIIGWIFLAILMSVFLGVLLGKLLKWSLGEPISRVGNKQQDQANEVYPRSET